MSTTNDQPTCDALWPHCAHGCWTVCDHNLPCRHHGLPRRRLAAAWLRRLADRLERR